MKVSSYEVGMESAREYSRVRTEGKITNLGFSLNTMDGKHEDTGNECEDTMSLSSKKTMKEAMEELNAKVKVRSLDDRNSAETEFSKLHQLMMKSILQLLFGNKACNDSLDDYYLESENYTNHGSYEAVSQTSYYSFYEKESEYVSFSATGVVKTEDGRELSVNLNIKMSREFESYYEMSYEETIYRLIDPLVINFDTDATSLSHMSFFFDIDANGSAEEISKLSQGSGFLCLDKNEDGIINDGSELFGTASGNGFFDLSQYDDDGNGWIDENDSVFSKLKIWSFDNNGNSLLHTLKEKNVGAIYLGNSSTQFALNSNSNNQTNGYIRNTGMFLYEKGAAGTIQHIDLVS